MIYSRTCVIINPCHMPKYVVHKIAFFFTDEAFDEIGEIKGSLVGIFTSATEAEQARQNAEIDSLKSLAGNSINDFIFLKDDYMTIAEQLCNLYEEEFGERPRDVHYITTPYSLTHEQARKILNLTGITFHHIVEYPDNQEVNEDDYQVPEEDLCEF